MKLRLIPSLSTKGSNSLRELAKGLSAKLGYKVFRSLSPRPNRVNLKYGHSVDKIEQFKFFTKENIPALEWTTLPSIAQEWLLAGKTVFGRKYLNSSCGKGIVILEPEDNVPVLPVYTMYKKKKREFRVHCYQDRVVAVTEKRKRKGFEGERETKIRNLANGYVFCQSVEDEPDGLRLLALRAARVSPSHFRGVDIGYNAKAQELFVIEVNSAPGIQGSNVQAYINAITN